MGFLSPEPPKPPAPPNPAITASSMESPSDALAPVAGSLISTTARGLRRRASTQRTSLIGGG